MTPKLISYSDHAVRRMQQRGFTRQDVRTLLAKGIYQRLYSLPGADARHSKRAYLGNREARVIYVEHATVIHVVTVEWTDEPPTKDRG